MIVRDVAPFITGCLDSIADHCDEIIITDTGSKDDTYEVVKSYLEKRSGRQKTLLLRFDPNTHPDAFFVDSEEVCKAFGGPPPYSGKMALGDFGRARKFGWDHATSDYIIWVDSDDLVVGADKIKDVIAAMEREGLNAAMVSYEYAHDAHGNPTCLLLRERLVKRVSPAKTAWHQPIHEVLFPVGAARPFDDFKIVHRREKVNATPPIPHRNIKTLLRHYEAQKTTGNVDPRTLFYLGMELRFHDRERAINVLKDYVKVSGWDEERAVAYKWIGEMLEASGRYDEAFVQYSASAIEFPDNPDGVFGCARIFYYRNDWGKCIEFTERGQKIASDQERRASVLHHNPLDRTYEPLRYVTRAYIESGRIKEGLSSANLGLSFNPNDIHLKANKDLCERILTQDSNEPVHAGEMIKIDLSEPIHTPPADVKPAILAQLAVFLWKRMRDNPVNAARFLESLPASIQKNATIIKAKELTNKDLGGLKIESVPEPNPANQLASPPGGPVPIEIPSTIPDLLSSMPSSLDIVIWTGPAWEVWSPQSIEEGGIGGSETAAVRMAEEFVKLGHRVRVYLDTSFDPDAQFMVHQGVQYIRYGRGLDQPSSLSCDIFITSRQPWALDLPFSARAKFLWVHDVSVGGQSSQLSLQIAKADKILCLSKWHKSFFKSLYPEVPEDKIVVTTNGILPSRYEKDPVKQGNRLIYSSSGNRGLDVALDLFPRIRKRVHDAELHVYYGFNTWRAFAEKHARHEIPIIEGLEERLRSTEGVVYHGRVGQQALADAQLAAKVWFYPTAFTETNCITALEVQAAGCVPVTTALAALNETVHHGILIDGNNTASDYKSIAVSETVKLLTDEDWRLKFATHGRKTTLAHYSWAKVASQWISLFEQQLTRSTSVKEAPITELFPQRTTVRKLSAADTDGGGPRLRLAFIYGSFSSSIHGQFDIGGLFTRQGLTGSESSFFHMVQTLAEMGHQVDVFCDVGGHIVGCLGGAHVYPLWQTIGNDYDAYISWNEPNHLKNAPSSAARICFQQLNDFATYSIPGFDQFVDLYVMPSDTHRRYLASVEPITESKTTVLPNPIDLSMFNYKPSPPSTRGKTITWCSSPDRGLHVLLEIFPKIRAEVEGATLQIFYRFAPWYEQVKDVMNESGVRARAINRSLEALGRNGENGVFLRDAMPNTKIIEELSKTRVFAYTCDPIRFTEGFSVATMDASASGCAVLISDADALPEIYGNVAQIIPGRPSVNTFQGAQTRDAWAKAIIEALTDDHIADLIGARVRKFALRYDRTDIGRNFVAILRDLLNRKHKGAFNVGNVKDHEQAVHVAG